MRTNVIYLLLACLLTVSACKKDDKGTANVMFINASPDAPALDVAQGETVVASLAYLANSGYVNLGLNNTQFTINKQGTDTTFLDISNPTWEKDKFYTVIIVDSFYELNKVLITDNLATPATGKALVRFIHACPNIAALDFLQNDSIIFENKVFAGSDFTNGVTPFTEFNAGTYNFDLNQADSSFSISNTPNVELQSGKVYTFIARGNLGGSGASGLGLEVITNQ